MTLHDDAPRRFAKHVVRRATLVARATASATQSTEHSTKSGSQIAREQTSSLKAPVVAIILGGFIGVFLLFVLVGITCKFANRPRSDNRTYNHAKAMYQPSAAGYGSAAAHNGGTSMYRANELMHDVSNPNAGLLDSAQPMGRGGRYEEADDSLGSSNGNDSAFAARGANGGFGMIPSNSASSFSGDESNRFAGPARRGHARGASTGIDLPGPAASATFRRNVSGSHPPVHSNPDNSYDAPHAANGLLSSSVMPDGSGFTPGQIFDHNAINGGAPKASAEMREHRTSFLGGPPVGVLPRRTSLVQQTPQQRPYARGPPPSSSKNRRSRYAQQNQSSTDTANMRRSRIDSVGPGTYRKSMFLPSDDSTPDFAGGSQMRRMPSNNNEAPKPLRRVESIGKGDPRRTSRYTPNNAGSRVLPMKAPEARDLPPANPTGGYRDGLPSSSGEAFLSAAGGQGGRNGRYSPYGGSSSNGSSSPLGPLGPNDPKLTTQQQQQQHQEYAPGGGVRMMPYGAGFGAPVPRPGMATTQISSPSSFAPAAPLGAGLGRGMEVSSHAAPRQIL
ncbi:hypothetical protein EX895_005640 [Sporisorium graminicola]|uniref:Uncharacterized protein n=1 Tax=Sporisorium graminicola TaxID=280036 RepID=A0A4U7KQM6_9BASI|nr:hypothetical protein EX895_005640 [Sporisorium graminicola]TKY85478.1 hypothetical protein EX895_005640 [Sporisorium graminicola]